MNRARRRGRTLSLRLWLILAVVAIVASTTAAETALGRTMASWQQSADETRLNAVRRIIGADARQWRDPAWQQRTAPALAALGVEARIAGPSGRLIYTTAGARAFLATAAAATPGAGAMADQWGNPAGATLPTFQKVYIWSPVGGHTLSGAAFLWFSRPAPGSPSPWWWALAAMSAIVLVLAVVVWLLGRYVLRPLAAMNGAVEGIAGGDLNVRLPPSGAREVAEVAAALEGMSAALGESLQRQSALEEERKLFIGAIAHDLRTPLFMLRGYLKGLESGVAATPEKRAHYISACRAKADALERLIADLFAYTRLEYLEQEPERAPLELGALLHETVEGVQPLAEAKGIALALDAPAEPCMLLGDGQLLARAVSNLLDNALRYTPEGGRIRVRWNRDGGALVFAVEDSGRGIAVHDLPHLFTPLYRGETSRNRQTGGAGLGLTIARRILQAHGGDLSAANSAMGGAALTGTLPAAAHTLPAADLVTAAGS